MNPLIVTGYVEIPNHPRSASEYRQLGKNLAQITAAPVLVFEDVVSTCWLDTLVRAQPLVSA
jgi:hypothetical protein